MTVLESAILRARDDGWPRAWGEPTATGSLRATAEDFRVDEQLGFGPSGSGEFDLVQIEKRLANTNEIARVLADHAGVRPNAVSYSGLKDRLAVTRQWFSIHRPGRPPMDFGSCGEDNLRPLQWGAHNRKLRRGTHQGNRFRIVLRSVSDDLSLRLSTLAEQGFPNYFGPQRFGRQAGNIERALELFTGPRARRKRRDGLYLSAARSLIFNEVLARRVANGSWIQAADGDVFQLHGSGSIFGPEPIDDTLRARAEAGEVDPTGPLWGRGALRSAGHAERLERAVAEDLEVLARGLESVGLKQERRSLRARPADLVWSQDGPDWILEFTLSRGQFATALIRELIPIS